jgi:hypothetical protein
VQDQPRPLDGASSPGITPAECRERARIYGQVAKVIGQPIYAFAEWAWESLALSLERNDRAAPVLAEVAARVTHEAEAAAGWQMAHVRESERVRLEQAEIMLDPEQPLDVKAQARALSEAAHEAHRTVDPALQHQRVRELRRALSHRSDHTEAPHRPRPVVPRNCGRNHRPGGRRVTRQSTTSSSSDSSGDSGGGDPPAVPYWFNQKFGHLAPQDQLQALHDLPEREHQAFTAYISAAARRRWSA